jgi:undecaprenyl phosphate N,N'-diacetylbacillosamine 1-phosphate transferase
MLYKNTFKRVIDFLLSTIGMVILFPVFLIICLTLYFFNDKKVFFNQIRPGLNDRLFKIIKFRTMNDKKDSKGMLLPDIQRVTRFGRILRKTSLDEIPQLINVFKGDMSLVGPRPLLPQYIPFYTKREKLRHTVRPGITGYAQINGRNNLPWDDRLELDAQYTEKISLFFDIKILLKTILNVIKRKDVVILSSEFNTTTLDYYRKNGTSN